MSTKLKITYLDEREPVEINAGPRAEVAMERQYERPASECGSNEHVYFLAYSAMVFAGQLPKDTEFDTFLAELEDVQPVELPELDEKAGPTRKGRRTTASPS